MSRSRIQPVEAGTTNVAPRAAKDFIQIAGRFAHSRQRIALFRMPTRDFLKWHRKKLGSSSSVNAWRLIFETYKEAQQLVSSNEPGLDMTNFIDTLRDFVAASSRPTSVAWRAAYLSSSNLLDRVDPQPQLEEGSMRHLAVPLESSSIMYENQRQASGQESYSKTEQAPPGGSSLLIAIFKDRHGELYIGKCNVLNNNENSPTTREEDPELSSKQDATKEVVANDIYANFGVNTPETKVARMPIMKPTWASTLADLPIHPERSHTNYILSKMVEGFEVFGAIPDFIGQEKFIHKGNEVIGVGNMLAVAALINDVDVIGGSGGNYGFKVADGKALCIKIDPGEAFNTSTKPVDSRCIRVATQAPNGILPFMLFPETVKKEFLETLALIAQTTDKELAGLTQPLLETGHPRYDPILSGLIEQRNNLRATYSEELKGIIGERAEHTSDPACYPEAAAGEAAAEPEFDMGPRM